MAIGLLSAAILILCLAHGCKLLRWCLFVEIYEDPYRRNLLQALSLGYLLNFFLPFKIGDIFRAFYAGKKMKNKYAFALSTVIVDRYLDVIAVGLIFLLFYVMGFTDLNVMMEVGFYVKLSLILLFVAILAFYFSRYVKKILKWIAGGFNETIEFHILKFSWSLIWNFKDIFLRINKIKIILLSVSMWGLYLSSYFLFAKSVSISSGISFGLLDIFILLFSKNSFDLGTGGLALMGQDSAGYFSVSLAIYMIVPLFLLIMISILVHVPAMEKKNEAKTPQYLNLIPHLDKKERLFFLEKYFSDDQKDYLKYYLKINQGISIIRDYSAGSNATTMLCMTENETFFRKYAFDDDGNKLYQQIQWMEKHKDELPLATILRIQKDKSYCYYDMSYNSMAVPLFHYVHSMPVDKGWLMIKRVLDTLECTIYKRNQCAADTGTIERYLESKVLQNIKKICKHKAIKSILNYKEIIINGIAYKNLLYYMGEGNLLDKSYLKKVFKTDYYADIHGDLTIENIICLRDVKNEEDEFYIIDPNTGNIHESPNLDYAKLLQSLHGSYEFLMATDKIEVAKNQINFAFVRSSAYAQLYEHLSQYMKMNFDKQRIQSIYCHEIIHWLRLMPYKIEKDTDRALLFYAGMIMVMNDVKRVLGELENEK